MKFTVKNESKDTEKVIEWELVPYGDDAVRLLANGQLVISIYLNGVMFVYNVEGNPTYYESTEIQLNLDNIPG